MFSQLEREEIDPDKESDKLAHPRQLFVVASLTVLLIFRSHSVIKRCLYITSQKVMKLQLLIVASLTVLFICTTFMTESEIRGVSVNYIANLCLFGLERASKHILNIFPFHITAVEINWSLSVERSLLNRFPSYKKPRNSRKPRNYRGDKKMIELHVWISH